MDRLAAKKIVRKKLIAAEMWRRNSVKDFPDASDTFAFAKSEMERDEKAIFTFGELVERELARHDSVMG
jgi:hypothetical protein